MTLLNGSGNKKGVTLFFIVFIVYNIVYDQFFYRMKWKYGLMELEFLSEKRLI